ncbi:GNAT family N-acetyltransferase [Streptomyces sp. NBC_00091]|uniref:GNAT family N-acetyltransferase n=1 Tax=Streptomyces sp. NBC_00091 TaxID=2975648 RepID=UPI00225238B9|nr:GNAT family N-acetyltransferase [Streptomyces sp. NBC_00091]MCX5380112.1 GNAT family N-acetyltransferase [Streptomyces sp. NBC_00091]
MDIRRREPDDLGACVRALAEVHRAAGYPVDWPGQPAGWLSPPALLDSWVAERDGRIAGHIGLCRSEPGDAAPGLWSLRTGMPVEGVAVISRLFVPPAERGHGTGALLMARAVGAARERALHPVLDVVASDTAAAALYERLGWSLLETVEQRWGPNRVVAVRCYAAPR